MIRAVNNTEKVLQAFESAIGAGLNLIGMEAAGYTQDNTPVRTGNLANSVDWEVSRDEKSVRVGFSKEKTNTDVKYAIYVEEGSVNNVPHHMLRRAVLNHKDEYERILKDALRNA